MVLPTFPEIFDGLFFLGILLLGIALIIVFIWVKPFLSKNSFVISSVGRVIPFTVLFPTIYATIPPIFTDLETLLMDNL